MTTPSTETDDANTITAADAEYIDLTGTITDSFDAAWGSLDWQHAQACAGGNTVCEMGVGK